MDEDYGIIEQVFTDDEDVVNDLEETNEIDEPEADPSIPTEDEDTGEGGDSSPVVVIDGDSVEPDEEDIINDDEDNDLTEPEIAVDEEEVEPIVSNEEELPTIGNVEAGDRVMIALINGEATVLGTVGSGDKQEGKINTITADVAELGTVVAGKASIADLNAATGRISTLETDNISVKNRLDTAEGNITSLTANKADISELHTNYITANQIAASYAKVDASNINTATIRNAWIDEVMVQSGLLANTGTVYTLDAIQLNADRITAGTIDVQRLLVTVNNHKYLVQFDAQGNPTYVKLDGDAIEDLTITADKIVAGAITAEKITTNNIVGTGGWINLRNGTFNYVNATTGQGLSWDGTNLLVNGSVTVTGGNVYTKAETDDAVDGAAAVATNFITDITDGIMVHPEDTTQRGVKITDQVDIMRNNASVAAFGDTLRIGAEDDTKITISGDGIAALKEDDTSYFSIGLSETIEQQVRFHKVFYDGSQSSFSYAQYFYLKTDDEFKRAYEATPDGSDIYIHAYVYGRYGSTYPYDQASFQANESHYFTKGTSETYDTSAFTIQYNCSSSTNPYIKIQLNSSWVRNYDHSSVKTYTSSGVFYTETPAAVYSFGANTENTKPLSFSIGNGTNAGHTGFACGRLNVADTSDKYALIVGNGNTVSRKRSNAFTVDWDGNFMASGMAGVIQMYAGTTAPEGWLICDGSEVSRTTYKVLYDVIGDTFGAGDGSTTFNLPDFRGRVGVGVGNGTASGHTEHTLGQKAGRENAIIPYHRHQAAKYTSGGMKQGTSTAIARWYATSSSSGETIAYTNYAGSE